MKTEAVSVCYVTEEMIALSEACPLEGAAKDRIENLRIDELAVRRLI